LFGVMQWASWRTRAGQKLAETDIGAESFCQSFLGTLINAV